MDDYTLEPMDLSEALAILDGQPMEELPPMDIDPEELENVLEGGEAR